ncbi:zf-HC2 domain-containing protein [Microbacterium sp. NPDC056234]|uniref:zf-HC2 domain-containing protein n=1 Tax=Microbacterium sp. NPDC056234 TaxID=3345757 RepID=UPI0035D70002
MNQEHERFAEWDAAYVLGALSPGDRAAYEAHASECAVCRAALVDLSPLPGLLARVPRANSIDLLSGDEMAEETPASDAARTRIVELGVARARRTRRTRWLLASAATAAMIAGIVAVPTVLSQQADPVETVALELVEDVPLDAWVRLEDAAWGTRLSLTCSYGPAATAPYDGWEYALVVVSTSGDESQLSTWRAFPDTTAQVAAGTALRSSEIAAIELRAPSGAVLMRSELDD